MRGVEDLGHKTNPVVDLEAASIMRRRNSSTRKIDPMNEEDAFLGSICYSDCLLAMGTMPSESVDLIYMDPPFGSNRTFTSTRKEFGSFPAFDDRWSGGITHYNSWMQERMVECRRLLKKTGSIFLHCDPHSSHYLKVIMDETFGMNNFRNEIIWKRQSGHNDGRQGSKHFGRIHDVILFYSKSTAPKWHTQYRPYTEEYTRKVYRFIESNTLRKYALGDIGGIGGQDKSCPRYSFRGFNRYWRYSKKTMEKLWREGRVVQSGPRVQPKLKRYLDEMNGFECQDLWDDIKPVGNGERVNYPTQKPLKLVERIICSSTDIGDTVLDPFCGSGTVALACHKWGRKWIEIDSSISACRLTRKRLRQEGVTAQIVNLTRKTKSAWRSISLISDNEARIGKSVLLLQAKS